MRSPTHISAPGLAAVPSRSRRFSPALFARRQHFVVVTAGFHTERLIQHDNVVGSCRIAVGNAFIIGLLGECVSGQGSAQGDGAGISDALRGAGRHRRAGHEQHNGQQSDKKHPPICIFVRLARLKLGTYNKAGLKRKTCFSQTRSP